MIGKALSRKTLSGGQNLVDPNDIPWSLLPAGFLDAAVSSLERAVGVPALLGVLLRVGQGCGMMPRKVYRRGRDGAREAAVDASVYELLHAAPSSESTPASFNADIGAAMGSLSKVFIRKIKSQTRRRVLELIVEDSTAWKPRRSAGKLVFDRVRDRGQTPPATTSDLIYVRGMAINGSLDPLSPIAAYRAGISVALQRQRFELNHFQHGAQPGTVLSFPADLSEDEALSWVKAWDSRHGGAEMAFRTAAIGGGATVTTLPVSLADAQFVESTRMTAEQIGGIYAMPKAFLNIGDNAPTDADWRFWVTFGLGWITNAVDQALNADRDLFPDRDMFSETVTDALLKPDIRTRYEAYKAARQAGWMTSNEIRRLENLPAHGDGDVLQVIPVGGGEPSSANSDDEDKQALIDWFEIEASSATGEARVVLDRVLDRARNGHTTPALP